MAPKSNARFAGAEIEGWRAYNITSDAQSGIGAWSDEALRQYLSTGHGDGHGSAAGPMAEAVEYSLRYLTPQDIGAMAAYLRTIEPRRTAEEPPIAEQPPAARASRPHLPGPDEVQAHSGTGARMFEGACASCHGYDGSGLETPYAALLGSRAVNDPKATNVVQVLLGGAHLDAPAGRVFMPPFRIAYTDDELAAVANYVTGRFGSVPSHVTPEDLQKLRQAAP